MAAYKTKKNGLIELMRFICSIWVAYFHGFTLISSDKFNGVILPVDFFFIVSGFFFIKSIQKYKDKSIGRGIVDIFWSRVKGFIVPLVIAASSVLLCNIIFPMDFGFNWPLSFLWFFAAQFVYLSVYFLLYRLIKKPFIYNVACALIIAVSLSLFKLEIKALDICFRGPAMIGIGILISQIPAISIKLKKKEARPLTVALNIIGFIISFGLAFYLIYRPEHSVGKIHLICCILFPAIVYFASAIPIRGRVFDFLGEISVFIYLAQCPILLHYYGITNDTSKEFYTLCACAVLLFAINRVINAVKKRRAVRRVKAA